MLTRHRPNRRRPRPTRLLRPEAPLLPHRGNSILSQTTEAELSQTSITTQREFPHVDASSVNQHPETTATITRPLHFPNTMDETMDPPPPPYRAIDELMEYPPSYEEATREISMDDQMKARVREETIYMEITQVNTAVLGRCFLCGWKMGGIDFCCRYCRAAQRMEERRLAEMGMNNRTPRSQESNANPNHAARN